jgi:cytochrome b6-f complex iron-sulfur subunit
MSDSRQYRPREGWQLEPVRALFSRRTMLRLSLITAGALSLSGLRRFLSYQEPPARPKRAVLEEPAIYPVDSVTEVPELGCWLVRDKFGFYAVSRICTHLGCQVKLEGDTFVCPCHGSVFAKHGGVITGPAVQSLRQVQVDQSADGRLVVDVGMTVPAGTRFQF